MLQGYILIEALCLKSNSRSSPFDFAQGGLFGDGTKRQVQVHEKEQLPTRLRSGRVLGGMTIRRATAVQEQDLAGLHPSMYACTPGTS